MNRIASAWFEFKGIRNTSMNVLLAAMPVRPHPAERGEQRPVAGRSGTLWIPDGGFDNIVIRLQCLCMDNANIDAVNAWLSGAGDLRFSDEPERVYRARVTKEFSRSNRLARFTAQEFTPSFDCQPFRYRHLLYPSLDDWKATASGASITNPGTYRSEPKITIEGSGEFTVGVGGQQLDFSDIVGGVVVDSEAMDCFDLTESELINSNVDMNDYPTLATGANDITWNGSISKITIRPRWRYL